MHVSKGQLVKLESGERQLNARYISTAARAFGVPESAVIEPPRMCRIAGFAGAGAAMHFYDSGDDPQDEAPMPVNGTDETVVGQSEILFL